MQLIFNYSDDKWISPLGSGSIPNDVKIKDINNVIIELGYITKVEVKRIKAKRGSISGRQHPDFTSLTVLNSNPEEAQQIIEDIIDGLKAKA